MILERRYRDKEAKSQSAETEAKKKKQGVEERLSTPLHLLPF